MRRVHIGLIFTLTGATVLGAGFAPKRGDTPPQSEPKRRAARAASPDLACLRRRHSNYLSYSNGAWAISTVW